MEIIISLGYRINSNKATEIRRWATQVLDMAIATLEHDGLINVQDLEVLNATSSMLRLPLPLLKEE